MLCLTRKESEEILIGDDISVVVLSINGGRVKLGIRAPLGVNVLRKELAEKIASGEAPTGAARIRKLEQR